jgi:hypothetical protein
MPNIRIDNVVKGNIVMHDHTVSDITDITTTYLKLDASNDPVTGNLLIKPTTDSLSNLEVQDKDANVVLSVDTVNNRVGVGTASPGVSLDVNGSIRLLSASGTNGNGLTVWDGSTKLLNYQGADILGITYAFFGTNRTYTGSGWSFSGWYSGRKAGTLQVENDVLTYYQFAASSIAVSTVFRIASGGNVGINEANPGAKLQVDGAAFGITSIFKANATTPGNLTEWQNSSGSILAYICKDGCFTFNEQGADADCRIEGDTATNLFVTDAGLDAVQIGTTTAGAIADFRASEIVFNDTGLGTLDFRIESDTEANMLYLDANGNTDGALYFGGTTNGVKVIKGGDLSFLGTSRIEWSKKTANSVTITTGGTDASSVVANLQTENDGNIFHLDEATGSPGLDFYVEFTSITAFNWVQIRGSYVGSSSHALGILLYDWVAAAWKHKSCMQNMVYNTTAEQEVICDESFFVPSDTNFIGTGGDAGKVRVRFVHPMAGNASHDIYLDIVALYQ